VFVIECACSEACRKGTHLESEIQQLHDQLLTSTGKLDQLEMEKSSLDLELRRMEASHDDKERDCQTLVKDFEYAKEQETALMVDRSVEYQPRAYLRGPCACPPPLGGGIFLH